MLSADMVDALHPVGMQAALSWILKVRAQVLLVAYPPEVAAPPFGTCSMTDHPSLTQGSEDWLSCCILCHTHVCSCAKRRTPLQSLAYSCAHCCAGLKTAAPAAGKAVTALLDRLPSATSPLAQDAFKLQVWRTSDHLLHL